jgi:hypothetical protein
VDGFNKQLSDDLKVIVGKFIGPAQYLQALTDQEKQDFVDYLWQYFPERDDLLYHYGRDLPPVEEGDIGMTPATIVHVAALGFDADCSLKPPPGKELFRQLSEHMLQDGFLTTGEPLLVVQSHEPAISLNAPWPSPGGSGPGLVAASLGYLKGMARSVTALLLVHRAWRLGLDMRQAHPKLYDSFLKIYVHHVRQPTKTDEALHNMKLSARGSIRKKTNLIQTVMMVSKLQVLGLHDFTVFVKKWNAMAVRADQIIGRRAVAMKLLLEHAPKAPPVMHVCTMLILWEVGARSNEPIGF